MTNLFVIYKFILQIFLYLPRHRDPNHRQRLPIPTRQGLKPKPMRELAHRRILADRHLAVGINIAF
jgi:hypothetical protein